MKKLLLATLISSGLAVSGTALATTNQFNPRQAANFSEITLSLHVGPPSSYTKTKNGIKIKHKTLLLLTPVNIGKLSLNQAVNQIAQNLNPINGSDGNQPLYSLTPNHHANGNTTSYHMDFTKNGQKYSGTLKTKYGIADNNDKLITTLTIEPTTLTSH